MKKLFVIVLFSALGIYACKSQDKETAKSVTIETMEFEINKSEEDWRNSLSPEEYQVLRQCGTEYAFTGEYYMHFEDGTYNCKACGNPLFSSETKYKSGSGWPSFYKPINDNCITEKEDRLSGMVRIEIVCSKCGGHLGHVFSDGPRPTGLRYCVNSISLDFKDEE